MYKPLHVHEDNLDSPNSGSIHVLGQVVLIADYNLALPDFLENSAAELVVGTDYLAY